MSYVSANNLKYPINMSDNGFLIGAHCLIFSPFTGKGGGAWGTALLLTSTSPTETDRETVTSKLSNANDIQLLTISLGDKI